MLQDHLFDTAEKKPINLMELPGPTGEANTLRTIQRGPILCMGPGTESMHRQIDMVIKLGGIAVGADGTLTPQELTQLENIHGVIWWGDDAKAYSQALANRPGPIIPLITDVPDLGHVVHERHLCIDTTAAGGNARLLAG